jgi:hypothetical protein
MQTLQTKNPAHAALLIGALVGFFVQSAAAQSVYRTKVPITVGPTVQVSQAFPNLAHGENLAAGDLEHAGRLITCSMVFPDDGYRAFVIYQNCYASFDSGKTWEPVLKLTEGWGDQDPVATYGRGDDVYVVTLVSREPDKPKDPDPDAPRAHDDDTVVYKSTDGGHTWREASRLDPIDREFINVDTTNGKYTGRIYVVGQGSVKDIAHGEARHSLQMWRSLDNGRTFLGPVHAAYPQGSILFGVGTGAVLSDGTLVALFGITKSGRNQNLEQEPTVGPNAELHVIMSKDGGETFSPSHKIADVKLDRQRSEGGILNQLTADPGSKAFKDRLYVVYPEILSDRIQIRLSYSSDKGKTWSKPVTVNDDRSPEKGDKGPDHLLPSVGVNKDGVVLVTWYDRREAKDNLGWRMRAAASLDGGETFSASVPITDFANAYKATTRWHVSVGANSDDKTSLVSVFAGLDPFFVSGGHTTGLAVDADSTFHPTWIDNHTGVAQLWSASLKVDGTVVKHGAADLADLKDISKSVTLELSKPDLDRVKGTLSVSARLKNISKDTVEGPVKVRVLTLESDLGVPEITNADNGQDGTGAVWDFTPQLSGAPLASMKLSAARTLTFRVSDLRPLAPGKDFKRSVLNLGTRVFGKLHKEKSDKDKDKDEDSEEEKDDK